MLVLSRKAGESIMIGEHIELVVIASEGDSIKIGIQAPKDVEIYRKEVFLAIRQSNLEASQHMMNPNHLRNLLHKSEESAE